MTTLYVANCTQQTIQFLYRLPAEDGSGGWARKVYQQDIPPGMQQRIHNECPAAVLKAIVAQHEKYGLIHVSEVPRAKGYIGMCYDFDQVVDLERFSYAADHNKGVLHQFGKDNLEATAISIDRALERHVQESRMNGVNLPNLRGVDVETLEDGDNPNFSEAVRIDHGVERADGRVVPMQQTRRTY